MFCKLIFHDLEIDKGITVKAMLIKIDQFQMTKHLHDSNIQEAEAEVQVQS